MFKIQESKEFIIPTELIETYKEYWMIRLGMYDWEVLVAFVDHIDEGNGKATLGQSNWCYSNKDCYIKLLTPEAYENMQVVKAYDMEVTLVHELLHPLFAMVHPNNMDSAEGVGLEEIIERMARALVRTRREQNP